MSLFGCSFLVIPLSLSLLPRVSAAVLEARMPTLTAPSASAVPSFHWTPPAPASAVRACCGFVGVSCRVLTYVLFVSFLGWVFYNTGKYIWGVGAMTCEHPYGECTKVLGAGGSSPADSSLCANSPKPPGPPPACPGIAYLAQNTTRFSVSCTLTY